MDSKINRFESLDALRGIAALGVVLFHISLMLNFSDVATSRIVHSVGKLGSLGVDVFFVVSGVCITLIYRRSSEFTPIAFWKRRWIRLWPTFAVSVVTLGLMQFTLGPLSLKAAWIAIASNLFMIPAVTPIASLFGEGRDWIVYIYWTLAYEMQFYLVFPFLVLGWKRFGWWPTQYLCILASAFAYHFDQNAGFFLNRWFQFLLGCQLCDLFMMRPEVKKFPWIHLLIANLITSITALHGWRWEATLTAQILVICIWTMGRSEVGSHVSRYFAKLGAFSYSLYLYHSSLVVWSFAILSMFTFHSGALHQAVASMFALGICLIGSWLMFFLIERHFIKV
jgi:peptidoglycan/LPS O-acetylase OafA/YrhL